VQRVGSLKYFIAPLCLMAIIVLVCCSSTATRKKAGDPSIMKTGHTIAARFTPPKTFLRNNVEEGSFAAYLRNLPLKPVGAKVKLYNGTVKENEVYDAVVDMEIGDKDLQQCADAIMRLRGEYLYTQKRFKEISFNFNSGFVCDYLHWMDGYRVKIKGNNAAWEKTSEPSNNYQSFRKYMDVVFDYAGTLALSKTLKSKALADIQIGDVFIKGGAPGHAEIVVDLAEDSAGHKVFLLAQSYMPAQDIQILKNYYSDSSPWYFVSEIKDVIATPEWNFSMDQLKGWE
jgi:hypothetical protein